MLVLGEGVGVGVGAGAGVGAGVDQAPEWLAAGEQQVGGEPAAVADGQLLVAVEADSDGCTGFDLASPAGTGEGVPIVAIEF